MNTTPLFYKNLWGDLQGHLDASLWGRVTEAWQAGKYKDSVYGLLDYVNPALRKTYGNAEQNKFQVPHGSVVVTIDVTDDKLMIDCPLVDISGAVKIPLMRKVAEMNFYPLCLAEIKLASDKLAFHYSSTLDTCEPFKTYYVLKEICQTADRYDDEFQEKFKAKGMIEPRVTYPTPAELDQAWADTNAIINETNTFIAYFDSQRWFGSSLDFLVLALKRIDLCAQVQGYLKSEIERTISELDNNQLSLADRSQSGRKMLMQIQQMGKEGFAKNVYQTETFIPEKWRTSGEQVKANIQNALNATQKYHNEKNYIASVIESLYCIYDLFYKNNMDHAVNNVLIGSLMNAAGKSWQDASPILLGGLQTINHSYNPQYQN